MDRGFVCARTTCGFSCGSRKIHDFVHFDAPLEVTDPSVREPDQPDQPEQTETLEQSDLPRPSERPSTAVSEHQVLRQSEQLEELGTLELDLDHSEASEQPEQLELLEELEPLESDLHHSEAPEQQEQLRLLEEPEQRLPSSELSELLEQTRPLEEPHLPEAEPEPVPEPEPLAGPSRRPTPTQPRHQSSNAEAQSSASAHKLFHVSIQDDGLPFRTCHYVTFWPFTTPTDAEISEGRWDDMEGMVAIAATSRLIVGRLNGAEGFQQLWTFESYPEESLTHVEWSYDPVTLRPILAAAGRGHNIYLFDHALRAPYRILRGHGHKIISLKFHPRMPHILASASGDKTIRIWNILGIELKPPRPGELRSQNYSQGLADEGNVVVAILAGESGRGHRSGVSTIAFHPEYDLIVSGGLDRRVAIWQVPPLPDVTLDPVETSPGYRPQIVHTPLFSTDTIHIGMLDSIEWLGSDVVISSTASETVIWQWTRYPFYRPLLHETRHQERIHVPAGDVGHSQNYRVIGDVPLTAMMRGGRRFGLHRAFDPTEDEVDFAATDLIVDDLICFPIENNEPAITVIAPSSLTLTTAPPLNIEAERPPTPDYYGDIPLPVADAPGDEAMPIEILSDDGEEENEEIEEIEEVEEVEEPDSSAAVNGRPDLNGHGPHPSLADATNGHHPPHRTHENEPRLSGTHTSLGRQTKLGATARVNGTLNGSAYGLRPSVTADLASAQPSTGDPTSSVAAGQPPTASTMNPSFTAAGSSTLSVPTLLWEKVVASIIQGGSKVRPESARRPVVEDEELSTHNSVVRSVAVSPRGAQWIVAVGELETILVWGLPPKAAGG